MKTCAIILARGGSKGIPKKNLAEIGGETLISRCVRTALAAEAIDAALVSTDDAKIWAHAEIAGAVCTRRTAAFASDTASSEASLIAALNAMENPPDVFAFLQCTAPLMIPEDIDRCMRAVLDGEADCAFCAADFHGYVWGEDGTPEGQRKRRQDEKPRMLEAGSCYAIRTERFLAECNRFCGRIKTIEIPPSRCLEIDTMEDLERAREIIEGRHHAIAG